MSDNIQSLKDAEKMAAPYAEKEHCVSPKTGNWMPGVILITLGTVFLFTTMTDFSLENWWALFIFIPAAANLSHAFQSWGRNGRFTRSARGSLTAAAVFVLIALTFLFEWEWDYIWPLFLIIGGFSALVGGILEK